MQAVNGTVQSRKCLLAIMLTYSLWRCNKHRNRSYNYVYSVNSLHRFRQRAALHLLAAFILKSNVV